MITFTTFVLWIHIASIVFWVGGLFATSFVFLPVLRSGIDSLERAAKLWATAMQRFHRISREIIGLVIITGVFNLINAGMARGFDFGGRYLGVLAIKITLFVAIIVIQTWQSFRLAPSIVTTASDADHSSDSAALVKRLYQRAVVTSLLSTVLAVTAILLGLVLKYG